MVEVELLVAPGCGSHQPLEALLRKLLAELQAPAELRVIVVETPEQARELAFPGSPTVRIQGRDLEPEVAAAGNFGLG